MTALSVISLIQWASVLAIATIVLWYVYAFIGVSAPALIVCRVLTVLIAVLAVLVMMINSGASGDPRIPAHPLSPSNPSIIR